MRDWSRWIFCVFLAACTATPAITVVRTSSGEKPEGGEIKGDKIKLKRSTQEEFAGAKPGVHVIRNAEDWRQAWPADRLPAFPGGIDASHMLVLSVAESAKVEKVFVERALETAEMLYFWVRESRPGKGCVSHATDRAFDAVSADRADKPVKVFIAAERGESCGDAPTAHVECKLATPGLKDQTWSTTVAAQPGDTIECSYTTSAQGKFTLVDRGLAFEQLPAGSSAKMSFKKGPDHAVFDVDVYGSFKIVAEAADEAGRRGKGTATIDVKPPKTKDVLVQLVWTGFQVKDESDSFPRVNLRVSDESKGQRCSAEIPVTGLCEVKTRGAYTYMQIPAGQRSLPVSVQYLDDRSETGPAPCVHVWFDGARTAEICDRRKRSVDEIWRVGVVDTTSGKVAASDGVVTPPSPVDAADGGAPPPTSTTKPPPKKKK